ELENLIERTVLLARKDRLDAEDLPEEVAGVKRPPRDAILELVGTPLDEIERRLLDETLRITGGNKTQAAKLLGIDVRTVARKLVDATVAHAHTWYADMAGLWIRTLHRIPLCVTLHSMEPLRPWKADQLGSGYLLSSWIEKTGVEAADRVIAVSHRMREDILAHFRV